MHSIETEECQEKFPDYLDTMDEDGMNKELLRTK
jgi:hypothetical protein